MQQTFEEFRHKRYAEERHKNHKQLLADLALEDIPKKTRTKLKNHYELYATIIAEVQPEITTFEGFIRYARKNPLVLLGKEVNPGRQSLDEKLQIEYYNLKFDAAVTSLPNGGKNALCLIGGTDKCTIGSPVGLKTANGERTKTFDGSEDSTYYFFKYTNESGGAQDNQIRDVGEMISMADRYIRETPEDTEISFRAVISGKYIISREEELQSNITCPDRIKIVILT